MKRRFGLLVLVVLALGLSACGGGGLDAVMNMTGNWVASETVRGQSYTYVLEVTDRDGELRGLLRIRSGGYAVDTFSFTGTRSGNQVRLHFGSVTFTGTLSGRNLILRDPQGTSTLTFTRQ